jgi:hypothetical protein
MKYALIIAAALFTAQSTFAQTACETKATEKKIYGAAKDSFIKKCEKDSSADIRKVCENDDISKKTSGAAKEAHIKKCMKDAAAG